MDVVPERFDHDSWLTALGTFASYGLVLVAMFVALFLVPYVVFRML